MVDRPTAGELSTALSLRDPSARLRAAMAAGTRPDPSYVEILIARCAIEPELGVREILTWALVRHESPVTVDLLVAELRSGNGRARSQALHTLSKIGDPRAWTAITPALLADADDDVARAAWRTAAGLAPPAERAALAERLAGQLGRGHRDMQLSLCRAFARLGGTALPAVRRRRSDGDAAIRAHAIATERHILDPDEPPFAYLDSAPR